MTETTSVRTAAIVWPTFVYRDAVAAIAFLEQAFGFVTTARHGDDAGHVHHAELAWPGGGGIMLGTADPEGALACAVPGAGSAYIVTDEVDALYERAQAAGATVTRELRDETDYESRGFTCRDPEGVYWSFGTYRGEGR